MALFLVIAIVIAFEPKWIRSEGIYELYSNVLGHKLGYWVNVVFDFLAVAYILFCIFFLLKKLIGTLYNSKLSKFNIKDGAVELSYHASVFNKHLDEIIYFFQASDCDVVVFEDLDRFDDPRKLFLKLREINLLINDSEYFKNNKNKRKPVRFIYAIKDDIFTGEERTKYFDYIISSIPIVNTLNSGDYLIQNYSELFSDIKSSQWIELGEYIDGMRELRNIINEFIQYENQVGSGLPRHKLLAMTIYKNKYPQDYSKLHCKSGVLYRTIEAKKHFADIANNANKQRLNELKARYQEEREGIIGIRKAYINYLSKNHLLKGVEIEGRRFVADEITESDELFDKFINNEISQYYTVDEDTDKLVFEPYSFQFDDIEREVSLGKGYVESRKEYENIISDITSQRDVLEREIKIIERSSFSTIISKIKNGAEALVVVNNEYRKEHKLDEVNQNKIDSNMCRMILHLIRNGYIDEDYGLFISYFHPGALTESDNEYLQALKLGISKGYDYRLRDTKTIFNRLQLELFDRKEILNYDLLDYLVKKEIKDNIELDRLIASFKEHHYIDFIVGYEEAGTEQKTFFEYLLNKWSEYLKITFNINYIEQKSELLAIFYKYCSNPYSFWNNKKELNDSYSIIINNISKLDFNNLSKIIQSLSLKFKKLAVKDDENANKLYQFVLNNKLFEINLHNMNVVFGEDFELKAYTTILTSNNSKLIEYVNENIEVVTEFIPETSNEESTEAIVKLLNNTIILEEWKVDYIKQQKNIINNLEGVNSEFEHVLFTTNRIKPTWDNVLEYYSHSDKKLTPSLKEFIEFNYEILKTDKVVNKEGCPVGSLFVSLFATNELSLNAYRALVAQFNIHFANTDLSSLVK